jgi:hypothetical protein
MTRLTPQKHGADLDWTKRDPVQVDYLFASDTLATHLDDVVQIPQRSGSVTATMHQSLSSSEFPRGDPKEPLPTSDLETATV